MDDQQERREQRWLAVVTCCPVCETAFAARIGQLDEEARLRVDGNAIPLADFDGMALFCPSCAELFFVPYEGLEVVDGADVV